MANLSIRITAKDSARPVLRGLSGGLEGLAAAVTAPTRAVGGFMDVLGKIGLAGLGISMLKDAVGGLAGALTGPIQAASDLNESMNKAEIVFGDAADSIKAFAESAAANLGLSKQEALSAAGSFGNLFVSMGLGRGKATELSRDIVQLGADLGSFNNIPITEALDKLRSGLVGQSEPLRVLGVNITEATVAAKAMELGLASNSKEISEAAKVQARYALILEQTKMAQGDFARTSAGLANSTRIIGAHFANLRSEIGERLLPVVAPLVSAFAQFLPTAFQVVMPVIDRLREALAGLQPALDWLEGNRAVIEGWAARVAAAFGMVLDGVGSLAGGFMEGLGAVLRTVQWIGQQIWEALQWLNPFASHSPPLVQQIEDGVKVINARYAELGASGAQLEALAADVRGLSRDMLTFGDTAHAIDPVADAMARFKEQTRDIGGAVKMAERDVSDLKNAISAYRDELARLTATPILGSKAFRQQLFQIDQEMARVQKRINEMKLAMPRLAPPPRDADKATSDAYQAAVDAQRAALKPLEDQLDTLRLQADQVRLTERLELEPLRRQLEEIAKPTEELDFISLAEGIGRARGEVERLSPGLNVAEQALKALREEQEATKAATAKGGGGGGAGAPAGGILGGMAEGVEKAKEKIEEFKNNVKKAREDLERDFNIMREKIEKALAPITTAWDRVSKAWEKGGLSGALEEVGNIVGEIGAWLGDQFALIDWTKVWNKVYGIGSAFLKTVLTITEDVVLWLQKTWAAIDWAPVWKATKAGHVSFGEWVETWDGKKAADDLSDWLGDTLVRGVGQTSRIENLRMLLDPQQFAANMVLAIMPEEDKLKAAREFHNLGRRLVENFVAGFSDALGSVVISAGGIRFADGKFIVDLPTVRMTAGPGVHRPPVIIPDVPETSGEGLAPGLPARGPDLPSGFTPGMFNSRNQAVTINFNGPVTNRGEAEQGARQGILAAARALGL